MKNISEKFCWPTFLKAKLRPCLHTDLYRKPTDRNTLLCGHCFHPTHLSLPISQFHRVWRICKTKYLLMVSKLRNIIYRHWHMWNLTKIRKCVFFLNPPRLVFRCPSNSRDKIVWSYIPTNKCMACSNIPDGNYWCGSCAQCGFTTKCITYTHPHNGKIIMENFVKLYLAVLLMLCIWVNFHVVLHMSRKLGEPWIQDHSKLSTFSPAKSAIHVWRIPQG